MMTQLAPKPTPNTSTIHIDKDIINKDIINKLKTFYNHDLWCSQLKSATKGMKALTFRDGLWFLNERLIIPADSRLREQIFHLTHDSMSHFGFHKTYKAIWDSYYWPGMCKNLEDGYVPTCFECQQHK